MNRSTTTTTVTANGKDDSIPISNQTFLTDILVNGILTTDGRDVAAKRPLNVDPYYLYNKIINVYLAPLVVIIGICGNILIFITMRDKVFKGRPLRVNIITIYMHMLEGYLSFFLSTLRDYF